MTRDELARQASRGRLPRGRLRPALGTPLASTTSTSTASRRCPDLLAPARPGDRRGGARARARGGAPRRPGARRGRARDRRVARERAAVPDRAQGGEGLRHRQPARRRVRPRASASASSRTSSRSGGAALEAVQVLRDAGLRVSNAICVVDREEGGCRRVRAPCGAPAAALSRPPSSSPLARNPRKSAWLSDIPTTLLACRAKV